MTAGHQICSTEHVKWNSSLKLMSFIYSFYENMLIVVIDLEKTDKITKYMHAAKIEGVVSHYC